MQENLLEKHSNTRISDKDCYGIVFRLLSLPNIKYIVDIAGISKKRSNAKERERLSR